MAGWSRSRPPPSARPCRVRTSTRCSRSPPRASPSCGPRRSAPSALRRRDVKLLLASRNPHKAREFAALLDGIEIVALPDDVDLPPETGDTFEANALPKARAAAAATGVPSVADDSGIEASALRGAPGVWSARYAGEEATDQENLDKLLREVPEDGDRRVAYVCALAYVEPGGREQLVHGRCEGRLATEPRGEGGFGYDPAFIPDDYPGDERTMAELTPDEKDAISHRGRAALLTLFAVRVAVRPPDREHHYGHGKAEHLAALGESAFLVLVSLFIAFESVKRLIDGGGHDIDVTWWALTVLGVVIVIDASRAITSFRTSRRYGSAALAANALHFTSDLAGSVAVLVGLLLVRAGHGWADSAAALFVAVLVVIAAVRLATKSIDVLMDRAVADADDRIRAALTQAGE